MTKILTSDSQGNSIKPQRISLPTYPFAKERYWLPEPERARGSGVVLPVAVLHPLLHRNTSDLDEQRFSSVFTGEEFFLRDHVVQGRKVLPGAAHLELARAAVQRAVGEQDAQKAVRLEGVVFARPVVLGDMPVELHIALMAEVDGAIAFEIYSIEEGVVVVHSQGRAVLAAQAAVPPLDLSALKAQCTEHSVAASACYAAFVKRGLVYGKTFQGIECIDRGRDGAGAVLALGKLSLPGDMAGALDAYVLHPSLLDAALQSSIGLVLGDNAGEDKLALPFAVEQLEIFGPLEAKMWAVVRYAKGSGPQSAVRKLDIDIADVQGRVCVRLKGISSRVVESTPGGVSTGSLLLEPHWVAESLPTPAGGVVQAQRQAHWVMLCEAAPDVQSHIEAQMEQTGCVRLSTQETTLVGRYTAYAKQLLHHVKTILQERPKGDVLVQVVVPGGGEGMLFSGLGGLLKSAQKENPRLLGQMLAVDDGVTMHALVARLKDEVYDAVAPDVRYLGEERQVLRLKEVSMQANAPIHRWKDGGVYLITGGAGGLGRVFATEIARQVKRPVLVLTGRAAQDAEKEALVAELERLGARTRYRAVDMSNADAVAGLIDGVVDEFGNLNGILHSAGVVRDSLLLNKTDGELQEVFAAKVAGLVALDEATAELDLDCFVMFSSVASVMGNAGQADYAAANGFMDVYARYRNTLVGAGKRRGHTLTVNWPLWATGGMQVDVSVRERMWRMGGLMPLESEAGILALHQGLAQAGSQLVVLTGDVARIRERLDTETKSARQAMQLPAAPAAELNDVLADKAVRHLVKLLAQGLHLPQQRIDAQAELETYGMDSVLAMTLTSMLEQTFGTLPKTLFFEYQSIDLLAAYFLEHHRPQLVELLGLDAIAPVPQQPVFKPELPAMTSSSRRSRQRFAAVQAPAQMAGALDIAIIGISGSYPKASTLQQYWSNLLQGVDCISEIPAERWDADAYFDAERGQTGKSYSKWGGFIDGVDCFDPLFFNISPREAEKMDPQERLFLQCVYGAMEDAGYTKEVLGHKHRDLGLGGNVGVFVGVMYEEYQLYAAQAQMTEKPLTVSGIASSIANRVSYFCNFHGPSLAINTMCSSSLTAIHLASQSLLRGNCEVAIAGGVNVTIHPNKYLLLSGGQFASSEGLCRSFGDGGDGYVPGEGVGAVLLKPLAKAIADGDQIYGVIKGSAINHGGKTNGYTVPNPNAQAQVIAQALKESGVHPRTISYIEAHGTGTALGDPIEIAGLSKAFGVQTEDRQYCAIGSAKSNIGHCESAAGIAGLTKVLLQMKHRTLVKSLHSEVLNPNIDFGKTPFVVQQANGPWERPVLTIDGQKREYPRIAGISSFGAGGANAHLIVEEYIAPERVANTTATPQPAMVVLSAKNEARLKEQVLQLLEAITSIGLRDANLADVAYTLQVGREAMEVRLGCVVGSLDELRNKLESYLKGERDIDELYVGEVKSNKDVLDVFSDKEMQEAIVKWMQLGKVSKLLDLWVKGLQFDWDGLHGAIKPQRISLPTYPFAKERYWLPEPERARGSGVVLPVAVLHPLLHRNTSDLDEQRFSSVFTGEEFFLRDHVVQGRKVLPGAAHLELARAAVQRAVGEQDAQKAVRLEGVVFARPVVLGDMPVELHIALMAEVDGAIAFEIYSIEEGVVVVHSQGRAVLAAQAAVPPLDLSALKAQCTEHSVAASACYAAFVKRGLVYGKTFQGIECIDRGRDGAGAVLALGKLSLPGDMAGALDAYVLHPSLLDAALQSSIGLVLGDNAGEDKLALPFAVEQLEIFGPLEAKMWAVVRYAKGSGPQSAVRKLDIDIADVQGRVCVRLKGMSSRVVSGIADTTLTEPVAVDELMLAPVWEVFVPQEHVRSPQEGQPLLLVGGSAVQQQQLQNAYPNAQMMTLTASDTIESIARKLGEAGELSHLCWIVPIAEIALASDSMIQAQHEGVLTGFRLVKSLLRLHYGDKALSLTILTRQTQAMSLSDDVYPAHASVHGLVGSMAKEYPRWQVKLVDLPVEEALPLAELLALPPQVSGNAMAYRFGQWYQQRLLPCSLPAARSVYRTGGVYVILGGAGGIGEVFSAYLIEHFQAQLIWIGRRAEDDVIAQKRERLAQLGSAPYYISADATDRASLQAAYAELKNRFGVVHGVVHATIVLNDQSLMHMDERVFVSSLSAKVDVSVNLAAIFQHEELDFVLYFSSLQSVAKAAGQSNYAAGCTFVDAYAQAIRRTVSYPVKVVNWGYWGSVGIVASDAYQQRMAKIGIGSIEPVEAMAMLERLLGSPVDQVAFVKTTHSSVTERLGVVPDTELMVTTSLPVLPSDMATATLRKLPVEPEEQEARQAFDALLGKLMWGQLHALGMFARSSIEVQAWRDEVRFAVLYERWLEQSLRVLEEHGYVARDGGMFIVAGSIAPEMDALWAEWEAYKTQAKTDSRQSAVVALADATLRCLPLILTGKRTATEVIFPNSTMTLVEGVYQRNRVSDYFNDVLCDSLITHIEARLRQAPQMKLRLIEIGAGTGGTSARLFERLAPYAQHIEEYCYTDISKAFLQYGQEQYGPQVPYLTTRLFNVEQALAGQEIAVGSYDVAIATNVLHATKDIRRTLRNTKALLQGQGTLFINEIAGSSLFTHLTFGLLSGWWLYEDAELRIQGSPGLAPETWQRVLEHEGFEAVRYPAQASHHAGQQIITARSDGVVRQMRPVRVPLASDRIPMPAKSAVSVAPEALPGTGVGSDINFEENLRAKATLHLSKLMATTLRLSLSQLDTSESLEKYGVDSILVVQLTNRLREAYPVVSSTLLFEHQTIDALVAHFIATQRDAVLKLVRLDGEQKSAVVPEVHSQLMPNAWPAVMAAGGRRRSRRFQTANGPDVAAPLPAPLSGLDIAIIGLSGCYAKATTVEEFWQNLKAGENCVSEIPEERWDWRAYFSESKGERGKSYSKWGGFIDGVDCFDPLFFNISPREAEKMDPQERLFLQQAYSCVADAGYTSATLCVSNQVGVFVGVMNGFYQRSNYWSIANRISSLFNWHGPSLAVDTACSASLTAIHLACESLFRGSSECAIAGGVNLILDPTQYVGLSSMMMLASGDECRSFGAQADGFIDGEGVGAVLLKPLAKAIADGDQIYGVIKGSAINHGGKTNGYTVPNPNAQAQVIAQALKESGVHPRTISYIEAHGTGTALGDPIEIAGLSKAFGVQTEDRQYCAIGSAKSNIGHCESAAGIAGLTKVLLQMKHRTLVKSLHSEVLNPSIDFGKTPFVVQQANGPWERPVLTIDGQKREYPRIAGISSFGAGGANAHLIVEEYIAPERVANTTATPQPAMVVLSAKNEARLKEQVLQLLEAITSIGLRDANLADVAYTLQVGREAMEVRLGCVVGSLDELRNKLESYLKGERDIDELYVGEVKSNKDVLDVFSDKEMQEAIVKWMQLGKVSKLLDLWVKGLQFDWDGLHGAIKPQRISLPTYPFAKERYWLPEPERARGSGVVLPVAVLHPLLHRNTSDLDEQRFSSVFTGEEFFLRDHVVQGRKVLPGAAHLELARAAVQRAVGEQDAQKAVRLEGVVFARPVVLGDMPVELHIALMAEVDGAIAFEIYSIEEGVVVVHSQGRAVLAAQAAVPPLDLSALKAQCTEHSVAASACYAAFVKRGLVYGKTFQGIECIDRGRDGAGAVLALGKLSLPGDMAGALDAYVLHPSLLDAALQSSIGLVLGDNAGEDKLALPFAVEQLEIFGPLEAKMWAVVRYAKGSGPQSAVRKLDIDIADVQGRVCVRLKGISSRVVESTPGGVSTGSLLLEPHWVAESLPTPAGGVVQAQRQAHWVMLCEAAPDVQSHIEAQMEQTGCVRLSTQETTLVGRYTAYAKQLLHHVKTILQERPKGDVLVQVVVPGGGEGMLFSGLGGLLKSAQKENPRLLGQMLAVDDGVTMHALVARLKDEVYDAVAPDVRYLGEERQVLRLKEVSMQANAPIHRWKDGGVYLITGGAGGLGRVFATEIARQVKRPVLVLTGRAAQDAEKEALVAELERLGARTRYRAVDMSNADAVAGLIDGVVDEFGNLNGILHSAGVVRDSLLLNKTDGELQEVFAAKVAGLVALDEATAELDLDCFVMFSSVASVMGNAGQADYAAANGFMDVYARYRNTLVGAGKRRGHTLTVNWPLWATGGMQVDVSVRERMWRMGGLMPLESEAGILALHQGLAQAGSQLVVLTGDVARIRERLDTETKSARQAMQLPAAPAAELNDVLADKAVRHLVKLLAQGLHLPQQRIDAQAELETYGMDSVLAMTLTSMLEQTFGTLPKTLFFEYQSIDLLAAYFLEHHRPQLVELLGLDAIAPVPQQPVFKPELPAMTSSSRRSRQRFAAVQAPAQMAGALDIAIIGISGSYPKASTLQQYWSNLLQGVDCISEIPAERWDADAYFDAERGQTGKSYSKWGGFIDGVDCFDPLFFNISPREAEKMDPQERLFLQCVYGAMEDAGYTKEVLGHKHRDLGLGGNVGVFVGVMYEEYQLYAAQAQMTEKPLTVSGIASSIANRVSYFCNFHGPSLAINTMCSSSLTAIHLASQSLLRGNCEVAIAGGVNVTIHPNKYLLLSGGQFASSEGLCRSFGDGGDGYVPGEGVGAVLLKPLAKAIADGDQIYGVIKGSAINHGGKTNGYTVPNPNAQAQVIAQALKESGVHPRTISYIEAHGTGTALGDPIEIAGLSKAFGVQTEDRQYCAIGSAKSNIGHCESAAGIAGLTKVLLQMKHRTLVKSLHSEVLNPNIDFGKTPFVVQQANGPWERPVLTIDGQKREYPRIAGISSFGAGGANAHLIVEEYIAPERVANTTATPQPAMVVLSAKNEARLKEQVLQLLEAITSIGLRDANLADVAYTLQVGREAMEVRLGCVVGSLDELRNKLESYLKGERDIDELYVGEVKSNKDVLDVFSDKEMQEAIVKWMQLGKVSKLLDLWVKGLQFDWDGLHGAIKPQRISLPTYPFAKERYWLPEPERARGSGVVLPVAVLHPLLHRNTSDLDEQRFSSVFTGEEFFLRDHVVQGRKVLPGAAHLELARAAVQRAVGEQDAQKAVRLEGVVFARPVVLGDMPVELHIALMAEVDGAIAFEIYSIEEGVVVVHSQGRAVLAAQAAVPPLDLSALKAQCTEHSVAASACYAAFVKRGLVYGKTFQGIECIDRGRDGAGAVLALGKLSLPGDMAGALDAYVLHPSLLDAALQSSIGLVLGDNAGEDKLALPFAVEQLEIFGPLEAKMWAVVRYAKGSGPQSAVRKLDIDIADVQGRVCVRLKGISSRVVESTPGGVSTGSLLLEPHWVAESLPTPAGGVVQAQRQAHWVMLCEAAPDVQSHIEAQMEQTGCVRLSTQETTLVGRYTAYAKQLLHHVKTILQERPKGDVLVQVVVPGGGEGMLFSGLGGLLKSAQKENPRLLGQMLAVDDGVTMHALVARLKDEVYDAVAPDVRYLGEERQVLRLKEVSMQANAPIHRWKDGGVYLITGGAGGLGRVFATEIARQVKRPVLVLTGRAAQDAEKEALVAELERLGARTRYRAVDMSNADAVAGLIDGVVDEFGNLNGILHSAGVVRDSLLLNKTDGELQEVFAAKVAGLVALDEATAELDLDCFVMFSSVASVMGNAGQADYAAANGFMDVYARYRNTLVGAGKRRGHTLTVNWPLWATGGMQVDVSVRERMWRMGGLMPLESEAGILALHQGLAQAGSQLVVLTGDVARIRERLDTETKSARQAMQLPAAPAVAADVASLRREVQAALVLEVAQLLLIKREDIDIDVELTLFGFDSISMMKLGSVLAKKFGIALSPTVFFEYTTLERLSDYLVLEHGDVLAKYFVISGHSPGVPVHVPQAQLETATTQRLGRRRSRVGEAPSGEQTTSGIAEAVAIIGVSGTFPQSGNLDALWENLKAGHDCISEMPHERWSESSGIEIRRVGVIEEIDQFDPLFFGISPREAEGMDPQQRLLMTYAWKAIEDAGYAAKHLSGSKTAILVGAGNSGYGALLAQKADDSIANYGIAGAMTSMGSARMSYLLNLHGPSESINTECSSSLVAVHRAIMMMNAGECDTAIVGGVNALLLADMQNAHAKAGMLSKDGRCKTFSSQADGYARGEGVGMLLLKKLSAAERDGDHIYGLIRGTAENHGGRASSLTAPNPRAQADLIKAAFGRAGVDPRTVSYIETHGTGTKFGDPIEIQGLKSAFKELSKAQHGDGEAPPAGYCGLGAVKSNIGNLEQAAGVAGIIKVLLQLKHKTLVKSLHCEEVNPYIDLAGSPFYIVQKTQPWVAQTDEKGQALPRRAGVSSFGIGGVNAHVVLEEYIAQERVANTATPQRAMVVLSAKNEARLKEQVSQLLEAITSSGLRDADLADVAYTLQVGREAMEVRLGCVVGSLDELRSKLERYVKGERDIDALYLGEVKRHKAFAADEEMLTTIDEWVAQERYGEFLERWVTGLQYNWSVPYWTRKPRRISLPTYPFAREQYWLGRRKAQCNENTKNEKEYNEISVCTPYIAPRNSVEERLCTIWADVLQHERVGVIDNFFEIGGNSLLITKIASRIKEQFGVALPMVELFEAITIRTLAAKIDEFSNILNPSFDPNKLLEIEEIEY